MAVSQSMSILKTQAANEIIISKQEIAPMVTMNFLIFLIMTKSPNKEQIEDPTLETSKLNGQHINKTLMKEKRWRW